MGHKFKEWSVEDVMEYFDEWLEGDENMAEELMCRVEDMIGRGNYNHLMRGFRDYLKEVVGIKGIPFATYRRVR